MIFLQFARSTPLLLLTGVREIRGRPDSNEPRPFSLVSKFSTRSLLALSSFAACSLFLEAILPIAEGSTSECQIGEIGPRDISPATITMGIASGEKIPGKASAQAQTRETDKLIDSGSAAPTSSELPIETQAATDSEIPSPTPEAIEPDASASASPALAPRIKLEVSGTRDGATTDEFRSDAENIFVRWMGENLPVNSGVRVAWIAEDVGDVASPNFVIDESETLVTSARFSAIFTLSRPKDGWAAGKYRVDLYLEDELVETAGITIKD